MDKPRHFKGTNNEKIWHAMRISKKFMVADLEVLTGVKRHQITLYISYLQRAGYLTYLPKQGYHRRYLLIKDTGPLYPILRQKHNMVYDQNKQENLYVK